MTASRPLRPILTRLLLPAALLTAAPLAALAEEPAAAPAAVSSVAAVDLARYSGKWFEIAAYPMFFQRSCIGDTTAEYSALEPGAIRVLNRCRTSSGFDQATGRATVVEALPTAA